MRSLISHKIKNAAALTGGGDTNNFINNQTIKTQNFKKEFITLYDMIGKLPTAYTALTSTVFSEFMYFRMIHFLCA